MNGYRLTVQYRIASGSGSGDGEWMAIDLQYRKASGSDSGDGEWMAISSSVDGELCTHTE